MASCELRIGFGATSMARRVVVLSMLALQACGDDDGVAAAPQTPAMSPAVTGVSGSQAAGAGMSATTQQPRPGGNDSAPRAGRNSTPRAGAAGDATAAGGAAAGMSGAPAAAGTNGAGGPGPSGTLGGKLMFTGELTNDTVIPQKYKCLMPRIGGNAGENVSPPLAWTGGPATTKSFALIVYDITYSQFHWAVWDIPATSNALPEGVPTGYELREPAGAHQANAIMRATDKHMYYGPCSGGAMAGTYEFRLFALDKPKLDLTEMSDAQAIQRAVDEAELEKVIWAGMPD